jgi:hypothetical protein
LGYPSLLSRDIMNATNATNATNAIESVPATGTPAFASTVRRSDTIAKLATAVTKAVAELKNPSKDSVNPYYNSKYADLATVRDAVLPVLARHDLAVLQLPCELDNAAANPVPRSFFLMPSLPFPSLKLLPDSSPPVLAFKRHRGNVSKDAWAINHSFRGTS